MAAIDVIARSLVDLTSARERTPAGAFDVTLESVAGIEQKQTGVGGGGRAGASCEFSYDLEGKKTQYQRFVSFVGGGEGGSLMQLRTLIPQLVNIKAVQVATRKTYVYGQTV